MLTIIGGFFIFLCLRRVRSGENSQMPWAISAQTIKFIDMEYKGTSVWESCFVSRKNFRTFQYIVSILIKKQKDLR
jgi:hypothetical protein